MHTHTLKECLSYADYFNSKKSYSKRDHAW
jgi:hypothetical protein